MKAVLGAIALVVGIFSFFVWLGLYANAPISEPMEGTVVYKSGGMCAVDTGAERAAVYGCLYLAGESITVQQFNNGWRIVE